MLEKKQGVKSVGVTPFRCSVPDEILEKPSSLTREEFSIIRQHTY